VTFIDLACPSAPDERRARALSASDTLKDESNPLSTDSCYPPSVEASTSPPRSAEMIPTMTKEAVSTTIEPADNEPHSSALRKRKAKGNRTSKSKKTAPHKAPPPKAKKGKRKHRTSVVESDAGDSDDGSSSSSSSSSGEEEEEEEMSFDESQGSGIGEDDEPSLPSLSRGSMCNTRCTMMDLKRLDRPEEPIEVVVAAITPAPQLDPAISPPSSHPSMPPPTLPSHGSTLPTSTLPPIPSSVHATLPEPDPNWPMWFSKAFTLLSARDLGPAFTQAIRQYIELERRNSFSIGGPQAGFKKQRRPDEVDWWVGRARMKSPEIKDVSSFDAKWWAWWNLLQPHWRGVADIKGPLGPAHREEVTGEDGWSVMDKHGQNAFLTVLATLLWWESGLLGNGQDNSSWLATVEDVSWVMSHVVDAG